jgi:hypothetical protein
MKYVTNDRLFAWLASYLGAYRFIATLTQQSCDPVGGMSLHNHLTVTFT